MKISINIPSYKRPKVKTLELVPNANVWVDEGEHEEYKKQNKDANIIPVPKGIQGNVCRIRNYILDRVFEQGYDACLILDDDISYIRKYIEKDNILTLKNLSKDEFVSFVEHYSLLCNDLGFKLWGVNIVKDKMAYREFTPFSFTSFIGCPFQCHLNSEIRYDENLPLKEDYDIILQHLNKYRGVLRVNAYNLEVKQSEQRGGCATYRNINREIEQVKLLQKKWGSQIIRFNTNKNPKARKQRATLKYNPSLSIPIKGV